MRHRILIIQRTDFSAAIFRTGSEGVDFHIGKRMNKKGLYRARVFSSDVLDGTVGKPSLSAFKRAQDRQQRIRI